MDIYGFNDKLTVIGEIESRLAPMNVRELERKFDLVLVKRNEPELLKDKTIYAI